MRICYAIYDLTNLFWQNDPWIYYAVVSVPANLLSHDVEPLGPHIKGPLMFRHVPFNSVAQQWQAGYFLLK